MEPALCGCWHRGIVGTSGISLSSTSMATLAQLIAADRVAGLQPMVVPSWRSLDRAPPNERPSAQDEYSVFDWAAGYPRS
jgi:hypothetical protein